MPETPNHGYNVPNEGQEDWHVPLNENFQQYDTDIEIRDTRDNLDNYDPMEGAKFFSTDTETIYLGNGSRWVYQATTGSQPILDFLNITGNNDHKFDLLVDGVTRTKELGIGRQPSRVLDVFGENNWNLDENDGDVRIGNNDYRLAIGISLGGDGAGTSRLRAKGGTEQLKLGAGQNDTVNIQESHVKINGTFEATGNKDFVQTVDTDDGEKEVAYTASEAPTARTETSGVARLDDGRAAVELPNHFDWVTDDKESLIVETTPYSADSGGLAVVERSTDRLVVEDLDGEGDYEFAYTVKGTRAGYADKQVVREPTAEKTGESAQAPADD